jgi:hypothetical protein
MHFACAINPSLCRQVYGPNLCRVLPATLLDLGHQAAMPPAPVVVVDDSTDVFPRPRRVRLYCQQTLPGFPQRKNTLRVTDNLDRGYRKSKLGACDLFKLERVQIPERVKVKGQVGRSNGHPELLIPQYFASKFFRINILPALKSYPHPQVAESKYFRGSIPKKINAIAFHCRRQDGENLRSGPPQPKEKADAEASALMCGLLDFRRSLT